MSLLAFLYAMFFQMSGTTLQGNAWTDQALDLTLSNLHSLQNFFGWVVLATVILAVVLIGLSILFGGRGFWEALSASGCFGFVAIAALVLWLVGFLHILAVGYLAANFTLVGATNPGFWILLVVLILTSWS